jgi:hypothetical protein
MQQDRDGETYGNQESDDLEALHSSSNTNVRVSGGLALSA